MIEKLIIVALFLGLMGWLVHLLFILQSLRSKKRWSLLIEYNTLHEGIVEIFLIIGVAIFYIYMLANIL